MYAKRLQGNHRGPPPDRSLYLGGTRENQENLIELFTLLAAETESRENRFAVIREIANNYVRQKEYPRLINFLSMRTNNFPDDPYNAYYLLMIAYAYMQEDADAVAALYFDIILKNYPDLTVLGESIHLACLNQLIGLSNNSEQLVWYYHELISRFSDRIDLGSAYFMLAQAYERIGDWNGAIRAYTQYLPWQGTIIQGFPNADTYAKQLVDFNNSPRTVKSG
ncbi:hypothetical protein AGMMS49579_18970 [Spirochaetia bacterium]|nr:hypothetical protein AGMMS49579_18970 [Spirochaetia bacterium]